MKEERVSVQVEMVSHIRSQERGIVEGERDRLSAFDDLIYSYTKPISFPTIDDEIEPPRLRSNWFFHDQTERERESRCNPPMARGPL